MTRNKQMRALSSDNLNGGTPIKTVRITSNVMAVLAKRDGYVRKIVRIILGTLGNASFDSFLSNRFVTRRHSFGPIHIAVMKVGGVTLNFTGFRDERLIELSALSTPDDGNDSGDDGDKGGQARAVPVRDFVALVSRLDIFAGPVPVRQTLGLALRHHLEASPVIGYSALRYLRDLERPDPVDRGTETWGEGGFCDSAAGPCAAPDDPGSGLEGDFCLARKGWQVAGICNDLACFGRRQVRHAFERQLAPGPQLAQKG